MPVALGTIKEPQNLHLTIFLKNPLYTSQAQAAWSHTSIQSSGNLSCCAEGWENGKANAGTHCEFALTNKSKAGFLENIGLNKDCWDLILLEK